MTFHRLNAAEPSRSQANWVGRVYGAPCGWTSRPVTGTIFKRLVWLGFTELRRIIRKTVEVTKALAALQPLYGKDNVEIITLDGRRVRGIVRSMKTTQALTTPSVKIECANGEVVKIPFPSIVSIKEL